VAATGGQGAWARRGHSDGAISVHTESSDPVFTKVNHIVGVKRIAFITLMLFAVLNECCVP